MDRYTEGWNDHIRYLQDLQAAGDAGSGWMGGFGISLILGLGCVSIVFFAAFQLGWANIAHPFAENLLAVGLLLLVFAYLFFEAANMSRARAQKAFNNKWHAKP